MKKRWYVTCAPNPHSSRLPADDEWVWTVSLDPEDAGWETDG